MSWACPRRRSIVRYPHSLSTTPSWEDMFYNGMSKFSSKDRKWTYRNIRGQKESVFQQLLRLELFPPGLATAVLDFGPVYTVQIDKVDMKTV
jgi:hypothetical protein